MQHTVCLFDLDGTLANTLPDLAAAVNVALKKNGFPTRPLSDFPLMVGDGVGKLVERALCPAATPTVAAQVLADFLAYYDAHSLVETRPYPGIGDMVDALYAAGYPLLVVTNKPQKQAEDITRHFFGNKIAGVYGGCDRYPRKPDPASVHLAMEQVGATPANTWFIGDSDVDVYTAHAAGLPCIGVAWGFRGEEELRRAGADEIVYSAEELLRVIKER